MVSDHHCCTRLGAKWFLYGPKMANFKVVAWKGYNGRLDATISLTRFHTTWNHFWVPLSQPYCVHSYTKYDISMLKLGRLYYTSRRFDLLASLGNAINYSHGIKLWNNLHSSSFPLLHLLLDKSTYFHHFPYIYLSCWIKICSQLGMSMIHLSMLGRRILLNIVVNSLSKSSS